MFTYAVEYCEINTPRTCINATTNATSVIVRNLRTSYLYQYKVFVFDVNDKAGESIFGDPFRTESRGM